MSSMWTFMCTLLIPFRGSFPFCFLIRIRLASSPVMTVCGSLSSCGTTSSTIRKAFRVWHCDLQWVRFREAILNAVSHRNYQFGGSIFVRQFRDRLVVESPGGLPFGITLDNILDRQLPRNRRIAEILSLCGMVERSGQGMNLMFELSVREANLLPDFAGTDDFFVSVTSNWLIIDKAMLSVINKIIERGGNLFATEDFLTIDALYHERPLTEKMQARLNWLIEMDIVEHIGRKKYALTRSLYAAMGKTGVCIHVALDWSGKPMRNCC